MSRLIRTYAVYTINRSIYRSIAEFYLTARHTQDQGLKDELDCWWCYGQLPCQDRDRAQSA
ncbi:hypothetical protein E5S67_04046 [Microcoleus sp. IPMA8]|uniref:Uncharacterized protein n=1 Tax=Microcoleus asticus IPMA8 TaxID=2563858 RepID=A0ABX2D355_9CYAN|nr:hypothetical protein [Microcoleus asticus IPMA8]